MQSSKQLNESLYFILPVTSLFSILVNPASSRDTIFWLATDNGSNLQDTLNIKTIAIEQAVGRIPEIKMIEENHPLATDQQNGITFKKAFEIVDKILQ